MSGSVIFDLFGIREKEGNYVLFIVLANFIAGFFYLLSAYGMLTAKALGVSFAARNYRNVDHCLSGFD
jgi:hypothetical protein